MQYAIVSDIHSNLQAWHAVLADIAAQKVRRIICLGDIVGYGPQPAAVLESVYRHVDYLVMGNHDAVVADKMSDEVFNDHAREMIRWTKERVSQKARSFLASRPLVLQGQGFMCCHGSLDRPQTFNYILTPQEALDTWSATDAPMVFVGHSHVPAIFVLGESCTPHVLPPQDFVMEEGKRYVVNAGSVGDPRDADPRASYCIFDDTSHVVTFRRVPFDYEALRDATKSAGLDPDTIPLLGKDPLSSRGHVRESLGFSPPLNDAHLASDFVETATVGSLRRSNARLKFGISLAVVALSAALGVATAFWRQEVASRTAFFPRDPLPARQAYSRMDTEGNLVKDFFPPGPYSQRDTIPGWRYSLEKHDAQSVSLVPDSTSGRNVIAITSNGRHRFTLESQEWDLGGHAEGRAQAMVRAFRDDDFQGKAMLSVIANRGLPDETILLSVPLPLKKKKGEWAEVKRITEKKNPSLRIGDSTKSLIYRVEADFSGTLRLSEPALFIRRD